MKAMLSATLFAVALSLAAGATQAADGKSANGGAFSVADMLQRKHDNELRAQLVAQGRWDEVEKLDAAAAQRLQDQREQRLTLVNERLAQSAGDGSSLEARAQCDLNPTHVK